MLPDVQHRLFLKAVESVPDTIFHLLDLQFHIIFSSGGALKKDNLFQQDLVGKSFLELLDPQYRVLVSQKLKDVLTGQVSDFEYEYRGSQYIANAYPLFEKKRVVSHIAVHAIDINFLKKQIGTQITEEQTYFRNVINSITEGIQIIGFDFRYKYLNDVAAKQGRQNKEDLLGKTMMQAYPGIENTDMFARLRRCMENRTVDSMENEFVYPDGTKRWFRLVFYPLNEGILIYSLDIDDWKKSEIYLKRLNRYLAVLSSINQAIIRLKNRQDIFKESCRIAVEVGGFRLA
ncbi:MAG: PAS domain-containing protein [Candidatus Kryptoniota bacterium]